MKKKDIILLCAASFISVILIIIYFLPSDGNTVKVYKDGKEINSWSLSENREYKLEEMTVISKDGCVWVENSVCRDKICEKTGKIHSGGSSIVCAPERIVIEITGDSIDVEI